MLSSTKWFTLSLRSQTSDSGWLSPRKLCLSWRQSESRGSATMTRSCCWPSPRLKMYRWEYKGTKARWNWSRISKPGHRNTEKKGYFEKGVFNVSGVYVSGGEGVPQLWDHWAEAEDSLPAGSAAAPQQTEGVPGEGDPTPQQGECGRDAHRQGNKERDISLCITLVFFFLPQALEEALNLHSPSSSQQPPGQGNFADAANILKKQELLTQIAVLKEQVRHAAKHACTHSFIAIIHTFPQLLFFFLHFRWRSLKKTSGKRGATGSEWTRKKKTWGGKLRDSRVRLLIWPIR